VDLTKRRNEIAQKMITILENASFHGQELNEEEAEHLIEQAEDLLESIE
jgi:F0F1-type ATP synthase epsilon subunit